METKYCPRCDKTKPTTDFYVIKSRRDGLSSYCMPCQRVYAEERDRTPEGKITLAKKSRKMMKYSPDKWRARAKLRYAVKIGEVQKPENCERCGISREDRRMEAHHPDYSKPLDVRWLCQLCHKLTHGKLADPSLVKLISEEN